MKSLFLKRTRNWILIFILIFLVISVSADLYYANKNTYGIPGEKAWIGLSDFKVFWLASRNMKHHFFSSPEEDRGNFEKYPVYDKHKSFYHFRYSPFIALLMVPFGSLHYPRVALIGWSLFLNMLFLLALFWVVRTMRTDLKSTEKEETFVLFSVFLGTLKFYLMNISQGQTDIVVAFLFVLFLIFILRKKDIGGGIVLSLILQMKLLFLPMLLYFAFRKKMRLVISTILSSFVFLLIPSIFVGFDGTINLTKNWIGILTMSVPSQLLDYKSQSIIYAVAIQFKKIEFVKGFLDPGVFMYGLSITAILISYIFIFRFVKKLEKRLSPYFEFSFLIITSLLFSPISWGAYFINLIVPLGLCLFLIFKTGWDKLSCWTLAAYFIFTNVIGTDLTKFIPFVNKWHFINISIGTVFLVISILRAYRLSATKLT